MPNPRPQPNQSSSIKMRTMVAIVASASIFLFALHFYPEKQRGIISNEDFAAKQNEFKNWLIAAVAAPTVYLFTPPSTFQFLKNKAGAAKDFLWRLLRWDSVEAEIANEEKEAEALRVKPFEHHIDAVVAGEQKSFSSDSFMHRIDAVVASEEKPLLHEQKAQAIIKSLRPSNFVDAVELSEDELEKTLASSALHFNLGQVDYGHAKKSAPSKIQSDYAVNRATEDHTADAVMVRGFKKMLENSKKASSYASERASSASSRVHSNIQSNDVVEQLPNKRIDITEEPEVDVLVRGFKMLYTPQVGRKPTQI